MERERVVSILKSLASGVDPLTNETADEVFAQPDVIRALFMAAEWISGSAGDRTAKAPDAPRADRPRAAGMPWSEEEDRALASEFDAGVSVSEIAKQHGRTRGGINSRLVKLGKLEPGSVRQRERFASVERPASGASA